MTSEKKKYPENKAKYNKEYSRKNVKMYTLLLNRNTDADMIEFIDSQPNKQQYFKELIRSSMAK